MTPTCRSCQTKFPGKDVCKVCGADPNAEPSIDQKIERIKAQKPVRVIEGKIPLGIHDELHVWDGVKVRAAHRARVRSLTSSKTSSRRIKHGRVGVR